MGTVAVSAEVLEHEEVSLALLVSRHRCTQKVVSEIEPRGVSTETWRPAQGWPYGLQKKMQWIPWDCCPAGVLGEGAPDLRGL